MHILLKKAKALARRKKLTRAQSQIIRNKMLQTGPIANSTYTDDNSSVIVYRIHVIMCSTGKTHKVLRNCGGETQDFPSILPPPPFFLLQRAPSLVFACTRSDLGTNKTVIRYIL